MLTGNIEVANPQKLSGWVQDASYPDTAVHLQIINNGMKIGRIIADGHRPDLEQAGIGNGCHAFSFEFAPGAIFSEFHLIRILQEHDGAEVPGSPLTLRASQTFEVVVQALTGSVDLVSPNMISGWARDELRPDTAVSLSISVNDKVIGCVPANVYREDLSDSGMGSGHHAFELPVSLEPSETHVIRVRRESDGTEIPGSPVTLGLAQKESVVDLLTGSLDVANPSMVSGWVRDNLQPDIPVSLIMTCNGEFVGRLLANSYRDDLKAAGIGNGRFAFMFEFPMPLAAFETHEIRVMRETDGVDVPGSPVTLSASPSFDKVVEESLSRALDHCGTVEDLPRKIDFLVGQIDHLLQQNADAESLRAERVRYRNLLQRWKSQPPQGEPSATTSVSPASMLRALVIDDRLPKADRDAGSNAILSHILSLQRLGYQVTIAPAIDFSPSEADQVAVEALGIKCCCAPYYGSVEEILRRQAHEFDLVYLHRISNASKYGELVTSHFPKARRIYSIADLYHVRVLRQAEVEDRPELVALGKRLRLAEFTATAFSNAVITHSKSETELLRKAVPGASVFTIPWAVKSQPTKVPFAKRKGFAFIGGFGHAPNQDAVRWLIKDIMPLVRAQDPTIECFLVGSDMPEQIRQIAVDGVVPIGYVDDLTEIFDRIRLTVAPLAYGAGLKGKVIESLSAGIPCVCTSVAAEGFDLPAPLRACVADDPAAIAASILRLHNKKAENEACRRAGLEFIAAEFSEQRLDALIGEAVGLSGKQASAVVPEKPDKAEAEAAGKPASKEPAKPVAAGKKRGRVKESK